ncbi:hypothetical protein B5V02_24485 [Mesorhizobium kowhaii]|uniref:Uncharacterized protein n=1 Tax=Mesorhizobium kowhaii TaxID=1300272 RepID=A0A2W7BYN8_9HYPH|nr:hypothetical protein B5V02_24485 [Mesorhizobium kowhaii]
MDNQHNSILEARWLLAVPLSLVLTVLLARLCLNGVSWHVILRALQEPLSFEPFRSIGVS